MGHSGRWRTIPGNRQGEVGLMRDFVLGGHRSPNVSMALVAIGGRPTRGPPTRPPSVSMALVAIGGRTAVWELRPPTPASEGIYGAGGNRRPPDSGLYNT